MSGEPLLQVKDLAVRFPIREGLVRERIVAEVRAVDGVSFEVAKGRSSDSLVSLVAARAPWRARSLAS